MVGAGRCLPHQQLPALVVVEHLPVELDADSQHGLLSQLQGHPRGRGRAQLLGQQVQHGGRRPGVEGLQRLAQLPHLGPQQVQVRAPLRGLLP